MGLIRNLALEDAPFSTSIETAPGICREVGKVRGPPNCGHCSEEGHGVARVVVGASLPVLQISRGLRARWA